MDASLIGSIRRNAEVSALREATVYDVAVLPDWDGGESYVFAATDFGHIMVYSLQSSSGSGSGNMDTSKAPVCALFKAPWDPIYSLHLLEKGGTKFIVW